MTREVPRPDELDRLANLPLGRDERAELLPPARGVGVHAALEEVLVGALAQEPCVVSFSGGRDSSAVLALAARAARRHGLRLPVPVIMRFPGAPRTEESAWQRTVLDHLGLADVHVLELADELDALGEVATGVLRRTGVLWPGNAYMHRPVIELASGGALLTGIGGDELFSTSAPRRTVRRLALDALPRELRTVVWRRRHPVARYAWLTAEGRARVERALAVEEVSTPYAWDKALRHWYGSRAFAALDGALQLVAEDRRVAVVNPLLDPGVLAELALVGGRRGFTSRTAAMRWLVGDFLPERALTRPTKASFGGAIWGPATRAFVAGWDEHHLDPYVDADLLRREMFGEDPDFRTILLLHAAWLRTYRDRDPATEGTET